MVNFNEVYFRNHGKSFSKSLSQYLLFDLFDDVTVEDFLMKFHLKCKLRLLHVILFQNKRKLCETSDFSNSNSLLINTYSNGKWGIVANEARSETEEKSLAAFIKGYVDLVELPIKNKNVLRFKAQGDSRVGLLCSTQVESNCIII
ncbi:CLUMA_CG017435, isoform A [Clunio marinus]|uniref:CLUMA_CG017435, isoform A n=1 Tax=Clunio marinus TaxID=568069 RepID=A0A1J1IYV3_9DIPT|nr:CLUMA_CG017435, isoform A [Clunio marinus]